MTADRKITDLGAPREVGVEIVAWSPSESEHPQAYATLKKLSAPEVRAELAAIAAEYGLRVLNFVVGERDKVHASGEMVIRLCVPPLLLREDHHNRALVISERVQNVINRSMDVLVIPERGLGIPTSEKEASRLKFYQYGNPARPLELVLDSRCHEVQRS